MAYQRGSDMLLKVDMSLTATPSYVTLAGMTSKKLTLKSGTAEVTNQDSPNKFRELLANAAIREVSLSASGKFSDAASENKLMNAFMAGSILKYQMIMPGFGTLEGLYQITSLAYDGKHEGSVEFDVQFESAGDQTWTAA